MAKISVRHGSEGPWHDPYSFTEITFYFTNPKRKPVIYHGGLAEWVKHGKRKYEGKGQFSEPDLIFERITGISVKDALKIPDRVFWNSMKQYTKEEQEEILECIEADRAILRNAM